MGLRPLGPAFSLALPARVAGTSNFPEPLKTVVERKKGIGLKAKGIRQIETDFSSPFAISL
jgi:hypothetical protein